MNQRLALRSIRLRRAMIVMLAALTAAALTMFMGDLPQFNVIQVAMNDENFTDLVLKTRGELPIDTNIVVVTYDRTIFDSVDRVDRQALALRLAALLDLKPRVVAVDFLIEDERPEAPDGDAMLASLIADHPNLIFGIFHEDSLNRFRIPPARFNLPESQLGCINLREDNDRTIRTYTVLWGDPGVQQLESFDVAIARRIDRSAAELARSRDELTFIIDYAGGIGEESETGNAEGRQIFPAIPIEVVYNAIVSGDSAAREAMARQFADKAILVGYGDIRNSQVTSVVDRFYTPLKPEKNALPDMHGVAIHANIVNTILKKRIVEVMAPWANFVWAFMLVLGFLLTRERIERRAKGMWKRILPYAAFGLFLVLAVTLPVLAFRYTIFKFSIYSPFTGILLAVPTLEAYAKGIDLFRDILRRRRARHMRIPWMREQLLDILRTKGTEERLQQALHVLQLQFHTACAVLFSESLRGHGLQISEQTIARPIPTTILTELNKPLENASIVARRAAELVRRLLLRPQLRAELRLSTSLYIAVTEVRRQRASLSEEELSEQEPSDGTSEGTRDYIDLAFTALTGTADRGERFDELHDLIEGYMREAATVLVEPGGAYEPLIPNDGEAYPYILKRRCRLHGREETFVYFTEQEDANNHDDYYDVVFAGRTIRCEPEDHPGLTEMRRFREPAPDRKPASESPSADEPGELPVDDATVPPSA